MEQEASQHGDKAQVCGKLELPSVRFRAPGCAARISGPFFSASRQAEDEGSQVQYILVDIAVGDQIPAFVPFIERDKKGASPALGGQGGLTAGVGAVGPLGQVFAQVESGGFAGVFPEKGKPFLLR